MRKLLLVLLVLVAASPNFATERPNNADYRARRVALAKLMENGALVSLPLQRRRA
jgi:hypothetical protein